MFPGRTLLEGEGRVGYRASPQLQSRPSACWWRLQEVPVPVPQGIQSSQGLTGFPISIAIEVSVALPQQLLGLGIGADLLAAVAAATWGSAIGDHGSGAASAEVPGAGEDLVRAAPALQMASLSGLTRLCSWQPHGLQMPTAHPVIFACYGHCLNQAA